MAKIIESNPDKLRVLLAVSEALDAMDGGGRGVIVFPSNLEYNNRHIFKWQRPVASETMDFTQQKR